ncbi:MAG: hypothetical protein WBB07_02860 [Mycobacterium sp.]
MSKKNSHVEDLDDAAYEPTPVVYEEVGEDGLTMVDGLKSDPKKAEPKPGDTDYDWYSHYDTADLYTHTYPDGMVVALRRFKDIYSKQWLRSIRALKTDFEIESAAVDRAACETARTIIDTRPCPIGGPDEFEVLWKAWVSADGEGLSSGE